jgi:hypothetical protein
VALLRALFLLLLLANLLFLAWATWIAPPAPLAGQATPSAPDRSSIRLLRESPAAAAGAATSDSKALDAATCVSAGPFLERAQAEIAASELQRLGFKSRLRPSTDEIRVGQWVRVPNLATADDAANALAAIKAAGLPDAEIVAEQAASNTISLGVFGDPVRAAQAVEVARKAGFTPEVSDRTRTADVYWLDVDRLENGGLPGVDALGPAAGPAAPPLELRACPAAAPAG